MQVLHMINTLLFVKYYLWIWSIYKIELLDTNWADLALEPCKFISHYAKEIQKQKFAVDAFLASILFCWTLPFALPEVEFVLRRNGLYLFIFHINYRLFFCRNNLFTIETFYNKVITSLLSTFIQLVSVEVQLQTNAALKWASW